MEILEAYPIQIEHWSHLDWQEFLGNVSDNGYNYILGISPEDLLEKDCVYFNISIEKKITNTTTNRVVFYSKTYSCFKVRNSNKKPTSHFFFSLIEKATYDFALIFHEQVQKTNLFNHKIEKPQFEKLKGDLDKTIEIWAKKISDKNYPNKPNWQSSFRDLPEIPEAKKWRKDSRTTLEQDISYKFLKKEILTSSEEKIFSNLSIFYDELKQRLRSLDYQSFTKTDFEDFKNYIFYAFNFIPLITNDLTVYSTYRLVVNENITKRNKSITDIKFIKYPTLEVVKKINKFNRANTPETNVFYGAETIDAALKEIRPKEGKLLTVGVWKQKDLEKPLISFPISHSDVAVEISEAVKKANNAFKDLRNYNSNLFMDYIEHYLKVLGYEFSKSVDYNKPNYHYEYFISSLFSERIFDEKLEMNNEENFKFDCIVYPSVGNGFTTENLAIRPSSLDKKFYLDSVLEFEILEADFTLDSNSVNSSTITLAKVKNFREAKLITKKGRIKW